MDGTWIDLAESYGPDLKEAESHAQVSALLIAGNRQKKAAVLVMCSFGSWKLNSSLWLQYYLKLKGRSSAEEDGGKETESSKMPGS